MAVDGGYCPYEVVPLGERIAGTRFTAATAFGLMQCLRSGPTIDGGRGTVFIHGVHDDMDTWGPLVHAAQQSGVDLGPMLFVDLPGFGRSENLTTQLDLAEVADAIMGAVDEVGFSAVRLVGHSMGTLVALEMATRHPGRAESVHLAAGPYYSIIGVLNRHPRGGGLAGAFAATTFATQYLLALTGRPGVAVLQRASRTKLMRALLWPFVAHPFRLRHSVLEHLLTDMRPASFRLAARNSSHYRDGMSWAGISCPVHAAYGKADRLVPNIDARRLRADLPDAQITTLMDSAHLLHLEQPHAALAALGLD